MTSIELLRWLHVIGATMLLGTGAGIAFFMMMADRTRDAVLIAHTARVVVVADFVFTASAVVVQPVTGYLLARGLGWPLTQGWLALSLILYVITGCCWLPVVGLQIRMRNIAIAAARDGTPLPPAYHTLFRNWFVLGIPAFVSVLAIIWLMLAKPAFVLFG
ncbi:MAG: DUF2269 domain-containing protein [Betaproteobacteria bacterium]|nr:DUF2269 domain-containing protein [Betaproteobacteria bacterium]